MNTDAACNTTVGQPGKFIVGIDTKRLGCGSSKNVLNGTSSENSPITVLLKIKLSEQFLSLIKFILCILKFTNKENMHVFY